MLLYVTIRESSTMLRTTIVGGYTVLLMELFVSRYLYFYCFLCLIVNCRYSLSLIENYQFLKQNYGMIRMLFFNMENFSLFFGSCCLWHFGFSLL